MDIRNLTDTNIHSGGVVAIARQQGHAGQLEKPSSSQKEISWSKVDAITVSAGSVSKDEKVADRFVVVVKRINIRGAKKPCC
jgi:DNA helicase TIP49 (TBP-interacting protein)